MILSYQLPLTTLKTFFSPQKESFKSRPRYFSKSFLTAVFEKLCSNPYQMECSSSSFLHTCASRRRSSLLWFFLSVPSPADWSTESNIENGRTFFSLSRKKVSPSAVVRERQIFKRDNTTVGIRVLFCAIFKTVYARDAFCIHPTPALMAQGPAKCFILQIEQGNV